MCLLEIYLNVFIIDVSIKWVKHTINWHLLHVEIDERFGGTCTFWIFASKNVFISTHYMTYKSITVLFSQWNKQLYDFFAH